MASPPRDFQSADRLDTHRKALYINLDERRYGTFAEIGAGQEVARWFFRVGGAAGTIAKSTSAYDMAVSDAIYGHTERYVSRERLQRMLDYEHEKNLTRLSAARGDTTAFFVFADTVAAKSFRNDKDCHGWMGLKFQSHPREQESQIVLHVRMLDGEAQLQQEALGVVGVNLLYGAFFLHHEPELLVESLLDNLSTQRIEIDMIEFSGIEFRHVERGTFRPVTKVNIDMLDCARASFAKALGEPEGTIVELAEITMRNLLTEGGEIDPRDFLARADVLAAAGKTVLISDYFEYYRLATYLRRCTPEAIAIVLGAGSLVPLLDEKYYGDLGGGILEAFGQLFQRNLTVYVYPWLDPVSQKLNTVSNLDLAPELRKLFGYVVERGSIVQLENYNPHILHIFTPEVLRRIQGGDASWEDMVPPKIAEVIKQRGFFDYRPGSA